MLKLLLPTLILAANPLAPIDGRYPDATALFECNFGEADDVNYDGWPDQWSRRHGPGYPHYLSISIIPDRTAPGGYCLRMELDGGAAAVASPPIQISSAHSYVLEGLVKTEGLDHNEAFFSLVFLDEQRQPIESFDSLRVRTDGAWQRLELGPIAPTHPEARFAVIELELAPGRRPDLRGSAMFTGLRLARLARLEVETNRPLRIYGEAEPIEVIGRVSGLSQIDHEFTFDLLDAAGTVLQSETLPLVAEGPPKSQGVLASIEGDEATDHLVGVARWHPQTPPPGYYRIRTTMQGHSAPIHRHELSLVVASPELGAGEFFGWSLPQGAHPLPLPQLAGLLSQTGIQWAKFPLWYDPGDGTGAEALVRFVELLGSEGISVIGLLADPPDEIRQRYGRADRLTAADLFTADPKVWFSPLESVLLRLSMKVRWWQLGVDRDTSFVGHRDLTSQLTTVKRLLDNPGRDVHIGLGWDWQYPLPDREVPWRFVTLSARPLLTAEELGVYLDASAETSTKRFVLVEPLPRGEYTTEIRAADLVQRMVAARTRGADAAFVPDPFSDRHGLMHEDGSPGELLLPWRTTAYALAGSRYLGRLQLPGGSPNYVFSRGRDAVLMVWNQQPMSEALYLGEDVVQTNLWGRRVRPPRDGDDHVLEVDALPTFVQGLNEPLARWRLSVEFDQQRIPSVFGRSHTAALRFTNTFPIGVSGTVRLVMPDGWYTEPEEIHFQLTAGETADVPLSIALPLNANSGAHDVRLDFEIAADRVYRMSVYRQIHVGLGDVEIELSTRLADDGYLEIEQRLINAGEEPARFACDLFIPGYRRQRTQVIQMGRGQDVKMYRLPGGQSLLGETLWLKARELGGPRMLSYRFEATP